MTQFGYKTIGFGSGGEKPAYIAATGGSEATICTNYKVHTFTGPGTFCVTAGYGDLAKADFLVVAGGGGGGGSVYLQPSASHLAGGGAGGYRESQCNAVSGPWTASPTAAAQSLQISRGAHSITVGAGGAGGTTPGASRGRVGNDSIFDTITSAGGGGGGSNAGTREGEPGGSGGGGAGPVPSPGGTGNDPVVSPAQGTPGGETLNPFGGPLFTGGGGGGTGVAGTTGNSGGSGGAGVTTNITNSPVTLGGGGAGGKYNHAAVSGGAGGGGNSGPGATSDAGDVNTGGGGGAGGSSPTVSVGGAGGSGKVVIRYRFQ